MIYEKEFKSKYLARYFKKIHKEELKRRNEIAFNLINYFKRFNNLNDVESCDDYVLDRDIDLLINNRDKIVNAILNYSKIRFFKILQDIDFLDCNGHYNPTLTERWIEFVEHNRHELIDILEETYDPKKEY
jgi:hypothetical protein